MKDFQAPTKGVAVMELRFCWLQKYSSEIDEEKRSDDLCLIIYLSIEDKDRRHLQQSSGGG